MTVGAQVKQTIASLKGVEAVLESFYNVEVDTDNQKHLSSGLAEIRKVVRSLDDRVKNLEYEESQYKGF